MKEKRKIPTYQFFKKLVPGSYFEYSALEKAYNSYDASTPHRHNYYEILFFNEGGGTHEVDFESFNILKRSVHFVLPRQVHHLKRNKNVTGHVIAFDKDLFLPTISFFEELPFFQLHSNAILQVPVDRWKKLSKLLFEIATLKTDKHLFPLAIHSLMNLLFIELLQVLPSPSNKKSLTGLTRKFLSLLDENFLDHHTASAFADMMHVSPAHLNDTIKKDTGRTTMELVHGRLLLEAKRLLFHSGRSIKQIALDLHYDDPSYFNRFFKTHTHLTPLQFRRTSRNQHPE